MKILHSSFAFGASAPYFGCQVRERKLEQTIIITFISALISALFSFISAAVLAIRLKSSYPQLHGSVDSPIGSEWWPFWVFHFLSPTKFSGVSGGLKALALTSMATLALSVVLLVVSVIPFASQS